MDIWKQATRNENRAPRLQRSCVDYSVARCDCGAELDNNATCWVCEMEAELAAFEMREEEPLGWEFDEIDFEDLEDEATGPTEWSDERADLEYERWIYITS